MAPGASTRKKRRKEVEAESSQEEDTRQDSSPKRKRGQKKKVEERCNSFADFRSKKLAVKSTETENVYKFDTTKIKAWGVLLEKKAPRICVEIESGFALLPQSKIIGCVFEKNLGLKDIQEALILLVEDNNESQTTTTCYAMSREAYTLFDQSKTEKEFPLTPDMTLDHSLATYPRHSNIPLGGNIENYILSVLKWSKITSPSGFHAGTKEVLAKHAEFASGHLPKVITAENIELLCKDFDGAYQKANIFHSMIFNIENSRCHIAPNIVKCRDYDPDYSRDLAHSMKFSSRISFEKRICFLIPVQWDAEKATTEEGYRGTPFEEEPSLVDIESCHFWIIGGQHTIMAYRLLMDDLEVEQEIRDTCKTVDAVMFWTPNDMKSHLVMMGLSRTLNHVHHTSMDECQFFLIARQVREIWKAWGSPTPESNSVKDSKWKVEIICTSSILEVHKL